MKNLLFLILIFLSISAYSSELSTKDSIQFAGQISSLLNYNSANTLPFYLDGRYIPQFDYIRKLQHDKLIDMEFSINIDGNFGTHPFDSNHADASIKIYRAWLRYSSRQFELRLGMQKINFGSASIIRPLMWFDQVDPRDPLQLTTGVWGLLGRYYFLNNANAWLWCLYGNNKTKPWEVGNTSTDYPEIGGRFQSPVPKGEAAITYHFRMADTRGFGSTVTSLSEVPENRIGIDGKWDLGVGLWYEGVWIGKAKDIGTSTNQEIMNLGTDYTFGIGNGLNVVFEQLLVSYDEIAFSYTKPITFSCTSISYPIGKFDNINLLIYYDWTDNNLYSFINWSRKFNRFTFYLMPYWNPKNYVLPIQNSTVNLYGGKGIQLMWVFNH